MGSNNAELLLIERIQRINDSIAVKKTERLPITPSVNGFFVSNQVGMSHSDAMYKGGKYLKSAFKVLSQYDWDLYPDSFVVGMGAFYDALGTLTMKWPGAKDERSCLADNNHFKQLKWKQ